MCTRRYCCGLPNCRPHTASKICWCVSVRPAEASSVARICHSIGVRWSCVPSRDTLRVTVSMCKLPIDERRRAAGRRGERLGAANLRLGARRELEHAERLRDVVVRAGVEQVDLFMLGVARRQHDDRHGGPLADLATDVDAGHVGQTEVEHDEIGPASSSPLRRRTRRSRPRRRGR